MEIFFIKKRNAIIYFIIFLIVCISVLYTQGMTPKVFQAFINQKDVYKRQALSAYRFNIVKFFLSMASDILGIKFITSADVRV